MGEFRHSLRHANINYRNGWFFVTSQVAKNKSIFGAIVEGRVELNAFGREVADYWRAMPAKYPELEIFDWVLMPNHFHALLRIHFRATNRPQHLGFLMSRFKGGSGYLYGKYRRAGLVEDIGEHLWQFDYWDDLVTDEAEFAAVGRYIRENPANWSRDRYGACTSYSFGDLALLDAPRIAFVASQGFYASELKPRRIWARAKARRFDTESAPASQARRFDTEAGVGLGGAQEGKESALQASASPGGAQEGNESALQASASPGETNTAPSTSPLLVTKRAASAANNAIISTFTSAQEREALRRALARGRRVIQVAPAGLPPESELSPALAAACREGRALVLSPQPPGSHLNKKVATWCNEYVLSHVDEIWAGDLSPNGMLAAMLAAKYGIIARP